MKTTFKISFLLIISLVVTMVFVFVVMASMDQHASPVGTLILSKALPEPRILCASHEGVPAELREVCNTLSAHAPVSCKEATDIICDFGNGWKGCLQSTGNCLDYKVSVTAPVQHSEPTPVQHLEPTPVQHSEPTPVPTTTTPLPQPSQPTHTESQHTEQPAPIPQQTVHEYTPEACQKYKTEHETEVKENRTNLKFFENIFSQTTFDSVETKNAFQKDLSESSRLLKEEKKNLQDFQCSEAAYTAVDKLGEDIDVKIKVLEETIVRFNTVGLTQTKITGIEEDKKQIESLLKNCKSGDARCAKFQEEYGSLKNSFEKEVGQDLASALITEIQEFQTGFENLRSEVEQTVQEKKSFARPSRSDAKLIKKALKKKAKKSKVKKSKAKKSKTRKSK